MYQPHVKLYVGRTHVLNGKENIQFSYASFERQQHDIVDGFGRINCIKKKIEVNDDIILGRIAFFIKHFIKLKKKIKLKNYTALFDKRS